MHTKYLAALILTVTALPSINAFANYRHTFVAVEDKATTYDSGYASAFCRDDVHRLNAGQRVTKDVGVCGLRNVGDIDKQGVGARVYDDACKFNVETLTGTRREFAIAKWRLEKAAFEAEMAKPETERSPAVIDPGPAPELTRNYCIAKRYAPHHGFAGSGTFATIKVAEGSATEDPRYEVVRR